MQANAGKAEQHSNPVKARTHEEFMADQIRFEQHRYEKLKVVLENDEQETQCFFQPQISKGSAKINEKKYQTAAAAGED